LEIERINRAIGYGFFQYVQEVRKKPKSTEKVTVYTHPAVYMPDEAGQQINYLV